MKKDEESNSVKLMETGISYEYLKRKDKKFKLTKRTRDSIEEKLKKKLKIVLFIARPLKIIFENMHYKMVRT